LTPADRDTLKELLAHCQTTIHAYETRITALRINDATDQAVVREQENRDRWERWAKALAGLMQ
jgi:hypothetical protein